LIGDKIPINSIKEIHGDILWGNLREKGYLEYLGVDGRGILTI